jgi:hypothetical protein
MGSENFRVLDWTSTIAEISRVSGGLKGGAAAKGVASD